MDILSPGIYPLNAALGSGYQALIQSENAHPATTIYEFTVTSRSDLAAPMGTEDNPGRGALGSYIVLAPAAPVAGVREDGPICIRISGRLRNSGTGVIIVDQADISKALLPIYGPEPAPGEPPPIVGYRPALGVRILAQATGDADTTDSKGWVFLRWDSVAARWRKLAIGGFMTS